MGFWDLDETAPVINPEEALAYYSRLMGGKDLSIPSLLIATFQAAALDHMAARLEIEDVHRWPTPIFFPLGRGSLDGRAIAIARLPIGAPAAASALELMIAAGARTVVMVGSAGSIQPALRSGSLVIATTAIRHDGVSHHYIPHGDAAIPSPRVIDALILAAARRSTSAACGALWTTDAPYRECRGTIDRLREQGVLGVEMEAAAIYAVAQHRGTETALIAAVSDELGDKWKPAFHTLSYRRSLFTAADIAIDAARTL